MPSHRILPVASVGFLAFAGFLTWQAFAINPGLSEPSATASPTERPVPASLIHQIVTQRTTTPTVRPNPTPWKLPRCATYDRPGELCRWSTVTPVLPIPDCGTPDPGAWCIRAATLTPMVRTREGQ